MKLWCLHGNLQLPSVWSQFEGRWGVQNVEGTYSPVHLCYPNLWEDGSSDFKTWTQAFCNKVKLVSDGSSQWLMGYSLGGRLALQAVLENPALWAGVIVIGTHPGLASSADRKKQLAWDRDWALQFLEKPWQALLTQWDALPVFCDRPNPFPRPEHAFSRERIAHYFEAFSKGNQDFMTPALSLLQTPPILYISGAEDSKYTNLGSQLDQICPVVQHIIIPDAGHRAPWENPDAFSKSIQVFLDATS